MRSAAGVVRVVRPDPAADAGFVGRDTELTGLLALLAPDHPNSSTAGLDMNAGVTPEPGAGRWVVLAVAGAPGVGKTALAQAAARAAVERGWFPGGAITVDLHGYDADQVVWPTQLYPGLLRALGVLGDQIPPEESGQATMYHQILDQLTTERRPVLLVWDNVGDPDQVAPLLPHGTGGHRVLITSRDSMARLRGARLLDLHILDPDTAVDLLGTGLRRREPTDRRITDDPGAAARLVELCGRLPLAVQIVAALLADEPARPLKDMADELTEEGTRLRGLDYDGRWAVRAAFDLSYRRLTPAVAKLFALLAAVPGPDIGLAVAAAVADRDPPATRAALRALCRAHLLDQQPVPPRQEHRQPGQLVEEPRWRMHDLIRLYAAEHLTPNQYATGCTRVLIHYRHTADLANQRFTALTADHDRVLAGFTTPLEAMAWVVQERAGLVAATVRAADTHPQDTAALAADLSPFLERARLLADWVTIASAAVRAAAILERRSAAGAWNNLGLALHQVRRFDEAIAAHQRAGDIFREVEDRYGEGIAWNNLGNALHQVRRFDEAIAAHEQARDIYRKVGDRRGEGIAWNNLGNSLHQVRRFDEAVTAYRQARDVFRKVGDRHREGIGWNNLGNALRQVRRFDEAVAALQQAGDISREMGDRHSEGQAWTNLGLGLLEVRRFDEAIAAHQRAGDISREMGDRHSEGQAWNNLGYTLWKACRFSEAIAAHQQARDICREVGDRHGEGTACNSLGNALYEVRRFDEAIAAHQQAQDICREVGDRHDEGTAWNNLGNALHQVGRLDEAINAYEHNIAICFELDDHNGQAQTLVNLGLVHAERDDPDQARQAWTDAGDFYTLAGADEDAARVREWIVGLDR